MLTFVNNEQFSDITFDLEKISVKGHKCICCNRCDSLNKLIGSKDNIKVINKNKKL